MSGRFERVAVVGLGLLGGSVALAARRAGVAEHLVGAGRRSASLERALARGLVDAVDTPERAVEGADLVVLATPVGVMAELLAALSAHLAPGTLVTDVGSVKGPLADTLPGLLPAGATYVGSHPMAGSHLRGAEHARADLLEGAACAITPPAGAPAEPVERLAAFWRALGARVVRRSPEEHDAEVAWTSHVPHALAFAFATALERAPASAGELAGSGFRDFTRIARSDPGLWGDILSANRKALVGPLQASARAALELANAVEQGDAEALERFLGAAGRRLAALDDARSGGATPDTEADPFRPDAHGATDGKSKGGL